MTGRHRYGLSREYARRVWDALDDLSEPSIAIDVARRLSSPLPSVRRALGRLVRCGYVLRDPCSAYHDPDMYMPRVRP